MTAAGDAGKHPWSDLEIPAHVHADECPMGVRLTRDKPCVRCFARGNEGCRQYPTVLEAKVDRLSADLAAARADAEALRADKARLDFLDRCNARLNAQYGTTYRWRLVLNHNVNRLMLGHGDVDLHDSDGSNTALPSCREAIDEAIRAAALALRPSGGDPGRGTGDARPGEAEEVDR